MIRIVLILLALIQAIETFASNGLCSSMGSPNIPGYDYRNCGSYWTPTEGAVLSIYKSEQYTGSTHVYHVTVEFYQSTIDITNYVSCRVVEVVKRSGSTKSRKTLGSFAPQTNGPNQRYSYTSTFVEKKNYEVYYSLQCREAWSMSYQTVAEAEDSDP